MASAVLLPLYYFRLLGQPFKFPEIIFVTPLLSPLSNEALKTIPHINDIAVVGLYHEIDGDKTFATQKADMVKISADGKRFLFIFRQESMSVS